MSNSEEKAFLTLRQSSFGNSFGPSITKNFCVSRPTSRFAHQDVMFAGNVGDVMSNLLKSDAAGDANF